MNRRYWAILTGILLTGLAVRAFYLTEVERLPDFHYPLLDHLYHDYWARLIAFGEKDLPPGIPDPMISVTPYFRPPGYPFFLAGIYRVFGTSPYMPRVVQMLVGMISCLAGFLFCRKWLGAVPGLIFAFLMATSWIFIYYEAKLHSPVLLVLLAILLVAVLSRLTERCRLMDAVTAGILLGLFAIVRPNILTFAAPALLWMLWVVSRYAGWRRSIFAGIIFVMAVAAAILPLTVRNIIVANDPVLISANGGINLFFGNNTLSDGVAASHPEVGAWSCFDYPRLVNDLEMQQGGEMSYSAASAYFAGKARRFFIEHPVHALKNTLHKACLFWSPDEVASYNDVGEERKLSVMLRWLPLPFSFTLVPAVCGIGMFLSGYFQQKREKTAMVFTRAQMQVLCLVLLFIATYSTTLVLFIVSGRYRLPVLPFLLMGTAFALYQGACFIRRRNIEEITVWCSIFVFLYVLLQTEVFSYTPRVEAARLHQAIAYQHAGKWDSALEQLQDAIRKNNRNAELYCTLGGVYLHKNELNQAVEAYMTALELDPGFAAAHVGLGKAHVRSGELEKAEHAFRDALKITPGYDLAHTCMGSLLAMQGDRQQAAAHYEKALATNPRQDEALLCLGSLLAEEGRMDEAMEKFNKTLEMNPANAGAHVALGQIYAAREENDAAFARFAKALQLDPECQPAREGLKALQKQ
jgi:tetratricopeptide (TPR) repeat protein